VAYNYLSWAALKRECSRWGISTTGRSRDDLAGELSRKTLESVGLRGDAPCSDTSAAAVNSDA
jgi:hypothetical protein